MPDRIATSELINAVREATSDRVVHPRHYNQGIEVWDFTTSHDMNFLQGNVVKYVARYRHKNGLEDLLKAQQYLTKLIETERAKNPGK